GVFFAAVALLSARDGAKPKRWGNAVFWALLAMSFLFGSRLRDFGNGLFVLAPALVCGLWVPWQGKPTTTHPGTRAALAAKRSDTLFLPALAIPIVTVIGGVLLKDAAIAGHPIFQAKQATLISLVIGALFAMGWGLAWFRPPLLTPLQEGRRLMD